MEPRPFLTELDSRAAIKGSRDPLGVQPIWTHFGRKVVGNLTTVSTSVVDFRTLVLGYHFVERLADEDPTQSALSVFLKCEQLAAYARGHVAKDWAFRGTERARRNVERDDPPRVRLSAEPEWQILGNQRIYGLWGLYTVAARTSGLLEGDPARLTALGRELVDRVYLPILAEAGLPRGDAIAKRLRGRECILRLDQQADRTALDAVARILKPRRARAVEQKIFHAHLVIGGPGERTDGLQPLLAEVLCATFDDERWVLSPARVLDLAKRARAHGERGHVLADELERILTCERLLVPATAAYEHVLASDQKSLAEIARQIRLRWGERLAHIDPEATRLLATRFAHATGSDEASSRWIDVARALHAGELERVLRLLIEMNAAVMQSRSGGPWVELRQDRVDVRYRDDDVGKLPDGTELREAWRHAYFLDALRTIAKAVEQGR